LAVFAGAVADLPSDEDPDEEAAGGGVVEGFVVDGLVVVVEGFVVEGLPVDGFELDPLPLPDCCAAAGPAIKAATKTAAANFLSI
jgi:hypothetical protein